MTKESTPMTEKTTTEPEIGEVHDDKLIADTKAVVAKAKPRTRGKAAPKAKAVKATKTEGVSENFVILDEKDTNVVTLAPKGWVGPAPMRFPAERVEELRDLLTDFLGD